MHKITNVEAQRVIAIMEDALDKLECLTYVPCTANPELLDALAEAGENPIRSCLQMLWQMEHVAIKSGAMALDTRAGVGRGTHPIDDAAKRDSGSFVPKLPYIGVDKAGKRANVVGGVSKNTIGRGDNGAGTTPGGGDLSKEECLEQVYQVTREWCRLLRRHPHAMEVLIMYARDHPRLESGIVCNRLMSDLTGIMYRRLSTSVEEEGMNRNLSHDLSEREKLAEEERFTLQQTLDATRVDKDRELGALALLIKKRRDELQEVNHANAVEMESIRSKTAEAIAKAKEDHEKKGGALTEHIERLSKEMEETAERYQQEEVASRKKKTKMEVELAATVEKYDRDMATKTAQIDDLKAKMAQECQELAVLQFHFNRIDTSDRYKQQEEKILAEVEMKVARAMAVVDGAATKLQSLFRGNRDRVEFQKAKKKKKKKKGKKRGKSGKKGKKR